MGWEGSPWKAVLMGKERGTPRRQWKKDTENALKISIIEAGRLANNRDEFRTAGRDATSSPGLAD